MKSQNTTDDRLGLPSASGIEAISLCPGKHNAERGLPPLPESEDAASGTRIHAALKEINDVGLEESELDVYNRCRDLEGKALDIVFPGAYSGRIIREERLWFGDRCSGQPDVVVLVGTEAAIFDFKTGRNEVEVAEGNPQLRTLAIALKSHYPKLTRIVVGIIAPWNNEPISLCSYTREDLSRAKEWLIGVLDAADKPDAPRIPGEKQCRFCRAKAVCPEAKGLALLRASEAAKATRSNDPKEIASRLTGESLGWFLKDAAFAESVFTACRDEAKRRLKAGEAVPGWQLKEGATQEVIKDLETVHQRFIGYGGTTPQYLACLSATKGKLETAMKEVTGYKGKELNGAFEALIQDCVEVKQNEPSLERVKGDRAING